jgi:hypothetical protein
MVNKILKLELIAVSLSIIFFNGCDEIRPTAVTSTNSDNTSAFNETEFHSQLYKHFAESGYDTTKLRDMGDMLLYEGDIAFDKNSLKESYLESINSQTGLNKTQQRGYKDEGCSGLSCWNYGGLVNSSIVSQVSVKASTTQSIAAELAEAVKRWNAAGSAVYMKVITSGNAHITITQTSQADGGVIAYSYYGQNNNPGNSMVLRPLFFTYGFDGRVQVLMHELGHCFNLAHTDGTSEAHTYQIARTPTTDPSSVMGTYATGIPTWTNGDLMAIRNFYPVARDPNLTFMGDVNGDGRKDLIIIANNGINVALANSDGRTFGPLTLWLHEFAQDQGWTSAHPRMIGDVNGDRKVDIVGFGNGGATVAISTGNGYTSQWWSNDFCYNLGWRVETTPRMLADVNGDGKADVVGFANGATIVGISTGSSFVSQQWTTDFCYNLGWRVDQTPRLMADINGDGKADVVGFALGQVTVGISTGSSFVSQKWTTDFCYNLGWRVDQTPRLMADVNGDGKADVVGFALGQVTVGISTGTSFVSQLWSTNYCYNMGWRVDQTPRMMADLNLDGKSDIIGLGFNEFMLGQSTGSQFSDILAYQYK